LSDSNLEIFPVLDWLGLAGTGVWAAAAAAANGRPEYCLTQQYNCISLINQSHKQFSTTTSAYIGSSLFEKTKCTRRRGTIFFSHKPRNMVWKSPRS